MSYPTTLQAAYVEIDYLRRALQASDAALKSSCAAMEKIMNDVDSMALLADKCEAVRQEMVLDAERYQVVRTKEFEPVPLNGKELDVVVDEFIETQSDAKELDHN